MTAKKEISKSVMDAALKRYSAGELKSDIVDSLGISRSHFGKALVDYGLKEQWSAITKAKRNKEISKSVMDAALKRYSEGELKLDIVDSLGISRSHFENALVNYGLKEQWSAITKAKRNKVLSLSEVTDALKRYSEGETKLSICARLGVYPGRFEKSLIEHGLWEKWQQVVRDRRQQSRSDSTIYDKKEQEMSHGYREEGLSAASGGKADGMRATSTDTEKKKVSEEIEQGPKSGWLVSPRLLWGVGAVAAIGLILFLVKRFRGGRKESKEMRDDDDWDSLRDSLAEKYKYEYEKG